MKTLLTTRPTRTADRTTRSRRRGTARWLNGLLLLSVPCSLAIAMRDLPIPGVGRAAAQPVQKRLNTNPIYEACFDRAEYRLLMRGRNEVTLCDLRTGHERRFEIDSGKRVHRIALSPDGRHAVLITLPGFRASVLRIDDDGDIAERFSLPARSRVEAVAFSPSGDLLATAGPGGVVLWDLATRQPRRRLTGPPASVRTMCFSPDGKTVAAALLNNRVCVWSTRNEQPPRVIGVRGLVLCIAVDDRRRVLTGEERGRLTLWNSDDASQVWSRDLPGAASVMDCAISPNGRTAVVSSTMRNELQVWDLERCVRIGRLAGHTQNASRVRFGADSNDLYSAGKDGTIRRWDLRTRTEAERIR